ncbi:hypothetical protein A6V29_18350 [Blastococcus sp. CCUG 61487]|nr:hypothetical protein A6V29_18350 [Blastococcus sp. CCUG 61487]
MVVGVDGSAHSAQALLWAVGQARLTGQQVQAVTTWQVPVSWGEAAAVIGTVDWEEAARETLAATVADVVPAADADRVVQRVLMGHPAHTLLEVADGAALLVVGSRGRGGFAGLLLGSVSQHVISSATCPVVVIRAQD